MKTIRLIILVAFLLTNTAYASQNISNNQDALRANIMTEHGKGGDRLKDTAAQVILTKVKPPSVGHMEAVVEASYNAAKTGSYDEAYNLVIEGLLGEDHVVNIETAIGILEALVAHYGAASQRGEKANKILKVVKYYKNSPKQDEMKDKIEDIVLGDELKKIDILKRMFEAATYKLQDSKNVQAKLLLNKALGFYYAKIAGEGSFLERDPRVTRLVSSIQTHISKIESNDFGLEKRLVQVLGERSGAFLDQELDFVAAHRMGIWHANSQILVMDQKGRILVQKRSDNYDKLDLSATGHLYKGEDHIKAAVRIIKSETGLSSVRKDSLQKLRDIKGSKKIGRQDYIGEPRYDEESDIFYFASKEIYNREYGKFFLYVLNQAELDEIEKSGNPLIQFHALSDFVNSIKGGRSNEFASTALNLFCHDDNINLVYSEVLGRLHNILKDIVDNPQEIPEISYIEDVYESSQKIIDKLDDWRETDWARGLDIKDEDFRDRSKAIALNKFKAIYEETKVLTTWRRLAEYHKGKEVLNWRELHVVLDLIKLFGGEAETVYGRALLNTFLTKGVTLERVSGGRFIFKHGNQRLTGVSISNQGLLTISRAVKKGINTIRRGAIAADMDLTTAIRDKNIDHEMLNYINQFVMIGLRYAVISGNEFKKQHGRSLTELISPLLIQNFVIYANGAGVKVKFNQQGEMKQDDIYIKRIKDAQLNEIYRVLNLVITDWSNVLRVIKDSNIDIAELKDADIEKIKSGIQDLNLSPDTKDEILSNIEEILREIHEVLNKDTSKQAIPDDKKREKAESNKAQLQSMINLTSSPFLDIRKDINEKNIVQVTLKPIIPSKARSVLADIVEKVIERFRDSNPPSEHIKITRGGSTSIDCTRKDVNKAVAAEDLIKEQKLSEKERELVLAIDDEMAPEKVGFPFLTVPGITVISNEKTKDGKKREYSDQDRDRIRAKLFWTGDHDLGYEVDATKDVYSALRELYMEEVLRLCNKQEVEPAIKKLKEFLESFDEKRTILPANLTGVEELQQFNQLLEKELITKEEYKELRSIRSAYGKVTIAGPITEDYTKYQAKNARQKSDGSDNDEYGVTMVSGLPMSNEVIYAMGIIRAVLTEELSKKKGVSISLYDDSHTHATISSIIRGTNNQIRSLEDIDAEEILEITKETKPFTMEFKIVAINGKGEILLLGNATKETEDDLATFRQRLIGDAKFYGRSEDRNTGVHTMIGYIKGFDKLTREEKHDLAQKIEDEIANLPNLGTMDVKEVNLIHYLHRSLGKIVNRIPLEFGKDYPELKGKVERTLLASNLSLLKATPVLFLDTEVTANPDGFKEALKQLKTNEGNIPVIVLTEKSAYDIKAELKISKVDLKDVQFRTLSELGLQNFKLEEVMSLITGIEDLQSIPLIEELCKIYKELQKVRDEV